MRAWVPVVLASAAAGCSPSVRALPGFEEVAWVAALQLDESGALIAGSEVRPLGQGVDLFADGPVTVVGWPMGAFGDVGLDRAVVDFLVPVGIPVTARVGCAPRLPTPPVAVRLDDGSDDPITIDVTSLPAISASWADPVCGQTPVGPLAFRAGCKAARCPWTLQTTGRCTFEVDLPCLEARLAGRLDPDGQVCLEAAPASEAVCAAAPAAAPASGAVTCSAPEPCTVEAFSAPAEPALAVQRVRVSDAPRYVPDVDLTGILGKLPSAGHLLGVAHDVAMLGDRVVVSTGTAAYPRGGCGVSRLQAYALDDLRPLATATATPCALVLAAAGDELLALAVEGPRFVIEAYSPALVRTRRTVLDDRSTVGPGEPPLSRPECQRAVELVIDDVNAYAVYSRASACGAPGTTVHVVDRQSFAVVGRHTLPATEPWRSKRIGDALWVADSETLTLGVYALPTLAPRAPHPVPPGFARVDVSLLDFALDVERQELVVATIRDQPALRRTSAGAQDPDAFDERAYFLEREADPSALWAAPFAGARGLVLGTHDGDPDWPTEAALYDRERFVILPGSVPVGYGPPRRLLADGRGGVLALLPWEAVLVRITAVAAD